MRTSSNTCACSSCLPCSSKCCTIVHACSWPAKPNCIRPATCRRMPIAGWAAACGAAGCTIWSSFCRTWSTRFGWPNSGWPNDAGTGVDASDYVSMFGHKLQQQMLHIDRRVQLARENELRQRRLGDTDNTADTNEDARAYLFIIGDEVQQQMLNFGRWVQLGRQPPGGRRSPAGRQRVVPLAVLFGVRGGHRSNSITWYSWRKSIVVVVANTYLLYIWNSKTATPKKLYTMQMSTMVWCVLYESWVWWNTSSVADLTFRSSLIIFEMFYSEKKIFVLNIPCIWYNKLP